MRLFSFATCVFASTFIFLTTDQYSYLWMRQEEYITVKNKFYPIISDYKTISKTFSIKDNQHCNRFFKTDREFILKLDTQYSFYQPLKYQTPKVEVNYPESGFKSVEYINRHTIKVNYKLYCLQRSLPRRGQPNPPDTREKPFIYIDLPCSIFYRDTTEFKIFEESFKSSTKTEFYTKYPYHPSTTTYKIIGWKYTSEIKIYRNNRLFREHEVSNVIPEVGRVKSKVDELNRILIIEIKD